MPRIKWRAIHKWERVTLKWAGSIHRWAESRRKWEAEIALPRRDNNSKARRKSQANGDTRLRVPTPV
jgi:hypothetical protein